MSWQDTFTPCSMQVWLKQPQPLGNTLAEPDQGVAGDAVKVSEHDMWRCLAGNFGVQL